MPKFWSLIGQVSLRLDLILSFLSRVCRFEGPFKRRYIENLISVAPYMKMSCRKERTILSTPLKRALLEHRNMPAIDAIVLISKQVEKLRKFDQPPPGRIGSIMRIIADGRMATLLEIEQVIEFLEEKREKLGGRKRVYQSMFWP